LMSALPPKADMVQHNRDVRFVPIADIGTAPNALCGEESSAKVPLSRHEWGLLEGAEVWALRQILLYGGYGVRPLRSRDTST
jgi:hypothetical protein